MKILSSITREKDAVSKAYVDGLLADYAKSENLGALASKDSLSFSDITAKPTTLSGYGINDAIQYVGTMNDPNTAYFRHVGYGYGEGGWYGAGPAFGFGANGTYYARIQALNSPEVPYLYFQSNSGGTTGKWFQFLFSEGNYNIESDRFSSKGDIVLHRNEDDGDTFLNYGPYANDSANLYLYGKEVGVICSDKFYVGSKMQVDGNIETYGQISGGTSTGSYERFAIKQNVNGTYFQAGVNDGSKQQGILWLSGINNTMMTACHVRADNTKIYGSLDVLYGAIAANEGINIPAGKCMNFIDSNGIKHQIAYDEEKGAIKVIGDFYTTGENAAGNAGEQIGTSECVVPNINVNVAALHLYNGRSINADDMEALTGLSVEIAEQMLQGAYNKVIDNTEEYPSVWTYTARRTATTTAVYFLQGDGYDVHDGYSLTYTYGSASWSVTIGEI